MALNVTATNIKKYGRWRRSAFNDTVQYQYADMHVEAR